MGDLGTLAIAWRLAVVAFVIVAPTLLFLGLVRALERLRDDALVEKWLEDEELPVQNSDELLSILAEGLDIEADAGSTIRCPNCGASNQANAAYCKECLGRVT